MKYRINDGSPEQILHDHQVDPEENACIAMHESYQSIAKKMRATLAAGWQARIACAKPKMFKWRCPMSKIQPILLTILSMLIASCSSTVKPIPNTANFMKADWKLDTRCVIPRGPKGSWDSRVAGDPCIVWDEDTKTWCMFYFASGFNAKDERGSRTGIAISKSPEDIGPGDWEKQGAPPLTNPEDLMSVHNWHKWWIIMDARYLNRAAKIQGKYWSVMVTAKPNKAYRNQKHIQVAHAERLAGPWTIVPQPILSPDEHTLDGLHCDTPTAYWFAEEEVVYLFYKGYPRYPQAEQKASQFGSGTILARWHPEKHKAEKIKVLMRPGQSQAWNQGWMSSTQIFYDAQQQRWYGLINGSPTAPTDESHREPAPSLGGWVICDSKDIKDTWLPDTQHSPFCYPDQLNQEELEAGLSTNFWRHHLLVTPGGQARIFFNSGTYGKEQMYSWVRE